MKTAICKKCGELPVSQFYRHHRRGYQNLCKKCKAEYNKEWYVKNQRKVKTGVNKRKKSLRKWFSEIKADLHCSKCDENDPACLVFHHRNPKEKEFDLATMAHKGYSRERILSEMKKCRVLCANCHLKLHLGRRSW